MRKNIKISKRIPKPDSKSSSTEVSKFINHVIKNGERRKSEKIVYSAFEKLISDLKIEENKIVDFFNSTIEKISCDYELRRMKFGSASYQVPIVTLENRKKGIAMRLLVKQSTVLSRNSFVSGRKTRSATKIDEAIFREIKNINHNIGASLKSKQQLLKTVQANKAFTNLFGRRKRKRNA